MENERNYNTQEEPEEERKEEREDTNVSPSFSDAQPLADAMMAEDENSDSTSAPEDSQEEPLEEEEGALTEETSREPSGIRTSSHISLFPQVTAYTRLLLSLSFVLR